MPNPLVSVIIPTKNSVKTLENTLKSVTNQTYKPIEIIVVDNFSVDDTVHMAKHYTSRIFQIGPERTAQRNFGIKQAQGDYILNIDSDMVLSRRVIEDCVNKSQNIEVAGVIIPEESFGQGFWAECKKLERSFYVGVDFMEAARFFRTDVIDKLKGYDQHLLSGEDWDLSQRALEHGHIVRINSYIYHDEGKFSLIKTLKKKVYYSKSLKNYLEKQTQQNSLKKTRHQTSLWSRYKLFLKDPNHLFANPLVGIGMLYMKTCEFFVGGLAFLIYKNKKTQV